MARAWRYSTTGRSTWARRWTDSNTAKESSSGRTGVVTRVISRKTTYMATASNHGWTVGCLKAHGNTIGLMAMASLHGQMAGCRKAITRMIKNMGLASFSGKTARSKLATGKTGNNTAMASCRKMTSRCVGHGRKASCWPRTTPPCSPASRTSCRTYSVSMTRTRMGTLPKMTSYTWLWTRVWSVIKQRHRSWWVSNSLGIGLILVNFVKYLNDYGREKGLIVN